MTTGSIGGQGWRATHDDVELEQIVLDGLPQLGLVGERLAGILGTGWRGVEADAQIALALQLLGVTMSALLAAGNIKCDLDPSIAPTEIDVRPRGANNSLIFRCRHNPPHCWDAGGSSIACP
ncbi:hypothetical protein QGN32_23210 [Mycolicibacterium sp. ND9-15]|uniref:hypothetical protein n=1 Tax=Mycolicibacterium sp. ND9-15 TaxID=3042320 RepID=UPI002DDA46C3|nr:hypothetical protein [Mycolicibacterium sp. ND9-15]WSE56204.1 hypothetical protein QGN32_23210 [Mycolicibacterium sp. ND9-15]